MESRRWQLPHSGAIPSVWPGRSNWPTIWSCCTKSSSRLNDGSFRARPSRPRRRSVPSSHTDILKKSPRETVFGHKVFLSTGPSSLILDCVVERGNPADSNYVQPFLERHRELYGQVPRQSAWDGGFASAANLSWAKEQGVEDVAFAKKCGLTVESMVRSSWVYKELKRFRAGIEGCIGTLKHTFGLDRCTWKGWPHFQSYVHASVLTYNLVVLARLLL